MTAVDAIALNMVSVEIKKNPMNEDRKLSEKELSYIMGGSIGSGLESDEGRNNRNWFSGCSCDYSNQDSIRNINRASGCSCNCV